MERKVQKQYIDYSFGFPLRLQNVPMVKVRGTWTPDVNFEKVADLLLHGLVLKPAKLTGNEIKFIRLRFEMNLTQFAQQFYSTHPAVIKWEKFGNEPTNMNWATEKDIRLFILFKFGKKKEWYDAFEKLQVEAERKKLPDNHIDVEEEQLVLT